MGFISCGLGSTDGSTPTPQGCLRWSLRTTATWNQPKRRNLSYNCHKIVKTGPKSYKLAEPIARLDCISHNARALFANCVAHSAQTNCARIHVIRSILADGLPYNLTEVEGAGLLLRSSHGVWTEHITWSPGADQAVTPRP